MSDRVGAAARARTSQLAVATATVAALIGAIALAGVPARAEGATRTVHFQGRAVKAPASWPVYRLSAHSRMCVRLDRRAVYLGSPGAEQSCPASPIGRRRAILVDPAAGARARASSAAPPLTKLSAASDFTGAGFDACTAPSSRTMSAWGSSPYRAIGVYIGGENRGCSQPNLTAGWVAAQVAAGWHLIPTYVGLQAPTSSCGSCAKLDGAGALAQGTSAANDAVEQAAAVGIGAGSPIYFDMESYTPGSSASGATLAFLSAWTTRLHALGYESGVYSSSASGIADLASRASSPTAPDDVWIADWNGQQSTANSYVPASAWSRHQRIHQYRGAHDETYDGVTINIDNDYVDGATAGVAPSDDDPRGRLDFAGSPAPGQIRISGWAYDPSAPTAPVSVRAYVGGRPGRQGAISYDLGAVDLSRPDLLHTHPAAGGLHGFDVSFATVKSGREPVCVYAVDIGPGADKLLGCRTVGVPVPISLSRLGASRRAVRAQIACEWPPGTQCPGQILLRARVRTRFGSGRRAHARVVDTVIARRPFKLTGGTYHGFRVALSSRGRDLAASGARLRAQLVIAIPGGRVTHTMLLP